MMVMMISPYANSTRLPLCSYRLRLRVSEAMYLSSNYIRFTRAAAAAAGGIFLPIICHSEH